MTYEQKIYNELEFWKFNILKKQSLFGQFTDATQKKINHYIPDTIHNGITIAIKQMTKIVLYGSSISTSKPRLSISFMHQEALVKQKIKTYKKTGATEGGVTGAGGFLMSLADFPILISIKIKMLYDIAGLYGYDVKDYKERLFILNIFQMAFSSKTESQKVYFKILNWEKNSHELPKDLSEFDWLTFQQQYRDYIDLAKLAQMLPFVGAAVGAIANYNLIDKLGETAMMAYRIRHFAKINKIERSKTEN